MIPDPESRVYELLRQYDEPTACAATLICDRHPDDDVAFTVVEPDLSAADLTYGQLREQSTKFAAALSELGIGPGDHVATLMGKSAELVVALLGIWRRGAIHVPLFTAFAPPAITHRLRASDARLVICDADQLHKITHDDSAPSPAPWRVVVAGPSTTDDVLELAGLIRRHDGVSTAEMTAVTGGSGTLVELFTSGTTGSPKGVAVPLRALASFHAYQEFGLDVRREDVFWNAADPGWAYGLYYAILSPLATGTRSILLHAGFSPPLVWRVMERFGVTNFTAAPTVYRSLLTDPTSVPPTVRLRRASSAGEPLTPDVISWSRANLGVLVRDHYGQTEHGMFIANAWADGLRDEVHEGSMGAVLPGWRCNVLDLNTVTAAPSRRMGRVAIDAHNSPLMWFNGYTNAPDKTAERFTPDGHWYLTGDIGHVDDEGKFHFCGRDDDVIIMAGYRIGPFDVESVLVMHPSVIEAAVVARPDHLRGEVLEAFVVLREGTEGSEDLEKELQTLVKKKYAAHAYPRTVHFVTELPKTSSGKVQRHLLRRGML
ncbi:acyl-CoA synthetase [Mycolicibacterium smegmatis]|uniref:Acetate--CoA ligase n=2 Tax=Mycolicibacterium smegmatis (strain ATCC 700084 / mc(2)155) TaxID=246196 RepID=I7GB37_MYCS2|nr:acyl-CoA synthetase [Mycolicibacterium smegmatis]ABK73027.1 acetyl-coenzyme A synthetase [Mycolicibacterium smegmatis MC2 155]AFP40351.1 putative acetate--CoA ligase [Mycolicibacterium smegmatis MC2 155]AIU09096.1 AMP-dependent synthetase [Mycolicibacterium smegmatis MC2 155]AIU15721.1 AMP-dependent synthetase [Mycolicibacterium smegmatis]AIU22344.1 AMP-dependent synthetase [Mycolicibacterium smegmatis]